MTGPRHTPLSMLEKLVGFDTESSKSNLPLIAFVEEYLNAWGVPSIRLPSESGDKAALFATIGQSGRGGVVLSGHTDVVPVAGQVWASDPYKLRVADGKAYGRGAVDMKGFCAIALALVPEFLAAALTTPVHLFLSYDEETTCLGPLDGIGRFGRDLPRPVAVIVGEPTELDVVDAHKSLLSLYTTVHGREAHSSMPETGASAVMMAGDLLAELNRLQDQLVARGDPSGRFDPPYSTIHVGTIAGGTARNILAKECRFHWEVRGLPGFALREVPEHLARFADEQVLARLRGRAPDAAVETIIHVDVPGLAPKAGSTAETLALRLAGKNRTVTVSYATEAGHFQYADVPTVVCGPGSIAQAHQPDEFITLADLEAGAAFMRRLAGELAA